MYARVVRFKDVSPERMNEVAEQINAGGGPPEGAPVKGLRFIANEDEGTAVVIVMFETEEDMKEGNELLAGMDASDTPGTRVSADSGEVKARADM